MNPLFQALVQNGANNGFAAMLQRFQQFRNGFSGNAEQTVRQMLQSGRITQEQYNNAVKMAQQFQRMM